VKNIIIIGLLVGYVAIACNQQKNKAAQAVTENGITKAGEVFSPNKTTPVAILEKTMNGKNNFETIAEGKIQSVCQKKGCWMRLDKGNGENMMVTFKDYGFFMPKDCAGKTAVMKGIAYYDTISIDMLKHYAEDAGKPQSEIDKISQPEIAVSFEASGVILK
jgi:hypothetical protein